MSNQETPPSFKENVVIITGASRGIGQELAYQLAAQQAWLVLAARDEERLQVVAEACEAKGALVTVVPTDVSDQGQCRHLINQAVSAYGRIDTLINNAGMTMWAYFEDIEDLSPMEEIMRVNLFGSVYCTHYALPHLKKTRGRLVGISSLTGKTGVPMRSLYAASKHAMAGFFDSLRIELADTGISVTMIYPGFVQSEERARALGPDGQPLAKTPVAEDKVMPVETCARIIIDAAASRKREVVMTTRAKLGQWMKLILPGLVDRIARRAIEKGQ